MTPFPGSSKGQAEGRKGSSLSESKGPKGFCSQLGCRSAVLVVIDCCYGNIAEGSIFWTKMVKENDKAIPNQNGALEFINCSVLVQKENK